MTADGQAAAFRGMVQTVRGPVPPETLGLTLMHEHLLCDVTPPELASQGLPEVEITPENAFEIRYHWCRHYGNHILSDKAMMIAELQDFAAAGGGTVVELTIEGIKPDPEGLRLLSEKSGIAIVAGCGAYIESFAGLALARSVDEQAARMVAALREGLHGTDVRAGIIGEIGISDPPTPGELRCLTAAAIAQRETGASINVHPGRDPASPLAVVEYVRSAGGDVSRLIISHLDRTFRTADEALRLADTGAIAEWDFFGIESAHYPFAPVDLPHDGTRLDHISALVARGHGAQITISHDICTRTRLRRHGGHGYAHIPLNVVAMMRRKGFDETMITQMLVDTPRRLLALV
jgi:phosphotriesterase-related protein